MNSHRPHLVLLFLLASLSPAVTSPPLFILGDSTTNCGDNTVLFPLIPPNLTSCSGSRHRLLPHLLADRMGLPPLPPFFGGNLTAAALSGGIVFGSTPATIISGRGSTSGGGGERMFFLQSLSQQVREVKEVLQLLRLEKGLAEAGRVAAAAVFVVSFGTDDYVQMFASGGPMAVGLKYGRRGIARVLVSQIVRAVKVKFS